MQSLVSRLEIELPATPDSVPVARHAVVRLAEAVGAGLLDVKIAVSEAVGNAVVHAYRHGDAGTIELSAGVEDDKLVVVVCDSGVGMMPNPDSPGLGFGLPLIGNVCEDLHVEAREAAGTRVTMVFPLEELDY